MARELEHALAHTDPGRMEAIQSSLAQLHALLPETDRMGLGETAGA